MSSRVSRKAGTANPAHHRSWLSVVAFLFFVFCILASAFVWLLPIEVAQQWAVNRAGQGQFDRFEAVGSAEFSLWLLRIFGPTLAILVGHVWWNFTPWQDWIFAAWRGWLECTDPQSAHSGSCSAMDRVRKTGFRVAIVAWGLLFAVHLVHGIGQRIHEWPYFKFNSGNVVLPNISESNRAVIRYLQQATPPDARILVASDQKLFFLSYYLRPRTLLHRMHPDSEHVIPLKDQQRKLNAYRLEELSESDLSRMPHDYTLEYFEHPDFVDRSHVLDDRNWVSFIRQFDRNPTLTPQYVVRLRATGEASK